MDRIIPEINKPFWEIKHEWWIEDYSIAMEERNFFIDILKRHPDDDIGGEYRKIIKILENRLKLIRKEYKKIYGKNPKAIQ